MSCLQMNIDLVESFMDKLQREEVPLHTQKVLLKVYVDTLNLDDLTINI